MEISNLTFDAHGFNVAEQKLEGCAEGVGSFKRHRIADVGPQGPGLVVKSWRLHTVDDGVFCDDEGAAN